MYVFENKLFPMSKEKKLNKKSINKVQQAIDKAIKKHSLIENGDRILIGVSGGVDSLVLLENLAHKRKHYNIDFKLSAVHINVENIPYSVNKEYLENFCSEFDVELIFFEKAIDIDETQITTNPCFICSWNRRKLLFNYAKENNFNKLALGHHKDDAIETFMMNLVYHGSISSLPAKLKMFDGRMHLIRPMIYLTKEQILAYSEVREYKPQLKTCSFDEQTSRRKMETIINEMKKFNPNVKDNIFRAMSNIYDEYLPE